ncbi:MAG: hypothetical protein FJX67_15510 [Alphaproteobacteria bacterium]|nr:hypothetical protein [Alphaproteobacteria bacterium]
MAKAAPARTKKKAPPPGRHKKSGRGLSFAQTFLTVPLLIVLAVVAAPTTIVFLAGMMPSAVAVIIDTTPGRYAARCVFALNLAGLAPFLRLLWYGPNDVPAALRIVSDPYAWLVIYGAAGIGWLLFLGLPDAIAMVKKLEADRQVRKHRDRQHELVEEWGPSILPARVAATPPPK